MNNMQQIQTDPFIIIKTSRSKVDLRKTKLLKNDWRINKSWNNQENFKYVSFLKKNIPILSTYKLRKQHSIFKMMENSIKTRTSLQIKSHHQKLMIKFKTIEEVISTIETYLRGIEYSISTQYQKECEISQLHKQSEEDFIEVSAFSQFVWQTPSKYQHFQKQDYEKLNPAQFEDFFDVEQLLP